jgi:selenocysteine lyase/cysteine desulfurase
LPERDELYFDHASTSPRKSRGVVNAVLRCLSEEVGNPGRGGHSAARRGEEWRVRCRRAAVAALGGASADRWALTFNCTDAVHLALGGWLRPGDRVVSGALEHNAVRRALGELQARIGLDIVWLDPGADGCYDPAVIGAALDVPVRLVALQHASNVIGTIQPIAEIARVCRGRGVKLLVDGAQTAGAIPVDVAALGADFFCTAGHKHLGGPTGTGLLYVAPEIDLSPVRSGGTGGGPTGDRMPTEIPDMLEAGTPNLTGIAGLAVALEECRPSFEETRRLTEALDAALEGIDKLEVVGPRASEGLPIRCMRIEGTTPEETAEILDQSFGIAVRAGLHCAPAAHRWLGTAPAGATRISLGRSNETAQLSQLRSALEEIAAESAS